jgi:hypothetical protein
MEIFYSVSQFFSLLFLEKLMFLNFRIAIQKIVLFDYLSIFDKEKMNEFFQCSVCFENFDTKARTPRLLPCKLA